MTLAERYDRLCKTPSSINEHLPTLRDYASHCESVCELGVDIGQSTTAFLMAQPEVLLSIDLIHSSALVELENMGRLEYKRNPQTAYWIGKTLWQFALADSRKVDIPPVDLLLIDSEHCYRVIKIELERHSPSVRKFILIHDTFSFGEVGVDGGPGIVPAIGEFLVANEGIWAEREHYKHNNGLLVLERVHAD